MLSKISGGSFTGAFDSDKLDYCGDCLLDLRRKRRNRRRRTHDRSVCGLRADATHLDRRRSSSLFRVPSSSAQNLLGWLPKICHQMAHLSSRVGYRDSPLANKPILCPYPRKAQVTLLSPASSQRTFDPTTALQYFSSPTKYSSKCSPIFPPSDWSKPTTGSTSTIGSS